MKQLISDPSAKRKIFLLLALLGAVLVLLSSGFSDSGKKDSAKEQTTCDYSEYTDVLEQRLQKTIASIDGVGECQVMITLKKSGENVYAKNSESKSDESSRSSDDSYVLYDSEDGESPLLIDAYFPDVQGVAVVCSGGGNNAVREKIIETVSSLFGIPTNRISVSKIKE